jgi:hypothetical protein
MDEQTFAGPLSADTTSCIQNLEPFPFDQELVEMDDRIRLFSHGKRFWALTQIYLELSLPLQVALQAAEADLRQLGLQYIC